MNQLLELGIPLPSSLAWGPVNDCCFLCEDRADPFEQKKAGGTKLSYCNTSPAVHALWRQLPSAQQICRETNDLELRPLAEAKLVAEASLYLGHWPFR